MVRLVRVELQKGPYGLGFSIGGGRGSEYVEGDSGIYVSQITPNGVADMDGRLDVGDKILSVGGQSLTNFTQQQAVDCLRQTSDFVIINVLKHQASIEHDFNEKKKLTNSLQHLYVAENSTAHHQEVDPFDRSKSHSFRNYHRSQEIYIQAPEVRTVTPNRLPITPQVPDRNGYHQQTVHQQSIHHESNYEPSHQSSMHRTPQAHQSHHSTPQRPQNLVYEVTHMTRRTPQPPPQPTPQQQYHHQTPQQPQQAFHQHSPANEVAELSGVSHPRRFQLEKGSQGLGFNIVGGEGGEGIYVSYVTPDGVADRSGLVFVGDQLLEVNGVNLSGATHGFAVSTLKSCGRDVHLVTAYKPEEFNRFKARVEAGMQEQNNNQAFHQVKGAPNGQPANGYPGQHYSRDGHGSTVVHFGQREKSTGCCPWLS